MGDEKRKVTWASGDVYEPYVGRWSRMVAANFLRELEMPAGRDWLDVGCGTGALTQMILADSRPNRVLGVDPSAAFVAYAEERVSDPRVRFRVGDAQDLPVGEAEYDAVVSGLVINFVPDPAKAAASMRLAAKRGGIVAAYVWDYAGEMQMMRRFWDAAIALWPRARDLDQGRQFPLCQPEPLRRLFEEAGLNDVAVEAIDAPTVFRDFDDYWSPFLGGQSPAPDFCMSLAEGDRAALRERIRSSLPFEADGSIRLIARAWAVRGRK